MNKAVDFIKEGLYGHSIENAMNNLKTIKDTNPIAWFVVIKVLERINAGWEEEILPIETVNSIEEKFQTILIKILNDIDKKSLEGTKDDLVDLIKTYETEDI